MPSSILDVEVALTGATGATRTNQKLIPSPPGVNWGQIRCVTLRLPESNYTFTSFALRIARYPKGLLAAGFAVDAAGVPTTTFDPFDAPDERVIYQSGNVAPGAASATTLFKQDFPTNRRMATGPLVVGVQYVVAAGTAGKVLCSVEFMNTEG